MREKVFVVQTLLDIKRIAFFFASIHRLMSFHLSRHFKPILHILFLFHSLLILTQIHGKEKDGF